MSHNKLTLKEIFTNCPNMLAAVDRIATERETRHVHDFATHRWDETTQKLEEAIHELGGVELTLLLAAIQETDRVYGKVDGRRFIEKPYDIELDARRKGTREMAIKLLETMSPRLVVVYERFMQTRDAASTIISLCNREAGAA